MSTKDKIDTPFNIARKVFYRVWFLAIKAREHAYKAEEAGDMEKAAGAFAAFRVLQRQAKEAYFKMKKLDPDEPRPAIIDCDVQIDEDMRLVFPDVYAAENESGYADWKPE